MELVEELWFCRWCLLSLSPTENWNSVRKGKILLFCPCCCKIFINFGVGGILHGTAF